MRFYADLRLSEDDGDRHASVTTNSAALASGVVRLRLFVASPGSGGDLECDPEGARLLMRVLQQYFRTIGGDPHA